MKQFAEWEREQYALAKGPKKETLECVECSSKWFEIVQVTQIDKNQLGTIGQVPAHEMSYSMLKCIRCGELHEPPVNRGFNHPESKSYDDLLDTLQEPEEEWGGKRKKEETK